MDKIPLLKPFMSKNITHSLKKVLYSGWIGEGPIVKSFENEIGDYLNSKYNLCVNSGTSAIWLACHLANLKKGDKVITTPMTCSATNIPFLHFGADIVWADIDLDTGNISPKSIEEKIDEKTRLICIVDYGGRPCDIDRIKEIAKKYSVKVLEDAAQALGASYNGVKIGKHNDYVCFSLQAVKTITSVDGGILSLTNKKDYNRAKNLRWFGIDRERKNKKKYGWKYDIKEAGYKMHMNDALASIGLAQLKYLDKIIKIQRDNAKYYQNALSNMKEIKLLKYDKESSYWLYMILVKNRKLFIDILDKNKIVTSPIHQRNDKLTIFGRIDKSLKNVNYFDEHVVCIPNGYWITPQKREYIVRVIRSNFL